FHLIWKRLQLTSHKCILNHTLFAYPSQSGQAALSIRSALVWRVRQARRTRFNGTRAVSEARSAERGVGNGSNSALRTPHSHCPLISLSQTTALCLTSPAGAACLRQPVAL